MLNEKKLKRQNEHLRNRVDILEAELEKVKAENERLKANENLVQKKIEEFNDLIAETKDAKDKYTDAFRQMKLIQKDYKHQIEELILIAEPTI